MILSLLACTNMDLAQPWQLDRLRILGVRSLPAEPAPGQSVTLSSFTYVPDDVELDSVLWFGCLPEAATDFGCTVDPSAFSALNGVDFSKLTPKEQLALYQKLVAAGFVGLEPYLPPQWTAPKEALDGLTETEQLEGVSALMTLQAVPTEVADEGDIEVAYKRIPVSLAKTPNNNPDVLGIGFEGNIVANGGRVECGRLTEYELEPAIEDEVVEDYVYVATDGTVDNRTEEPYFTWYTEGSAEFDQAFSLYPNNVVYWTAPEEPGEYEIQVVMRDRRGGMGWGHITAVVRE